MTNTDLDSLHARVVTPPEAPHGVEVEGPDGQTWFLSQFELGGARALVNTGQAEPYHVAAVQAWDTQCAADQASDVDHAAALVLNAALDWERACERGFITEHMAAADELHKAIRAYMPLVTDQPAVLVEGDEHDSFDMHTAGADRDV